MVEVRHGVVRARLGPLYGLGEVVEARRRLSLDDASREPAQRSLGQTKTSAERLKMICDFIKSLMQTYPEKVMKDGLKYSNLLDLL